jgi:hypothetical protein
MKVTREFEGFILKLPTSTKCQHNLMREIAFEYLEEILETEVEKRPRNGLMNTAALCRFKTFAN